jgi:CHAT domain-containing protein
VGVLAGESFAAIGQPGPAWRAASTALLRAYDSADSSRVFFVSNILAAVAESQGLPRLALECQDEALRHGAGEHPRLLASAQLWRGHLLALLERPRSATQALQLAVETAASLPASRDRDFLLAELSFATASAANHEHALDELDQAVDLFTQQGRKDLLVMALHRRARAAKERRRYAAANADLEKALGLELERASALHSVEAARLSFVGTRQSVADELMALQVALDRPWNAFVTLQQVLAVAAPGRIRPQPAAEELSRQFRAERRTALVALTQLDDFSVAWVIAGGQRRAVTWPTARKDVRAAMLRYWRSLDGAESQLHAGELFELIARPWIELVRGFDELLIVPGAELAGVPFAGLFDQRRDAYLVEDLVLRFGAVADLAPPRTAAADPAAVVVFEPDTAGRGVLQTLPGARKEAETIAARYPRSTLIRGADAHRRALLRRLPAASIFHFAGHALPNVHAGEPGLLVSPSEQEDPFVTASDLAALDLSRVELVTLSGCSTARAGTGSWQVSWNLGRAALAAGAPAVLTTIADVADDEARDLMIDFYGSFDGPPARALAHAQRQAIRRWRADESPRRPSWPDFVLLSN